MARGVKTGGRKPGSLNKATASVREIAREYAPAVIERLGWLASHAESETAQIAAGREILDRAYGKSPQPMDGDGEGGPIGLAIMDATDEMRARALAAFMAKTKGKSGA